MIPKPLSSVDILPNPFAWIDITVGEVTLKTEKGWAANYIPEGKPQTFDVPAFAIAKYPVTNAQFAKFLAAGGYGERQWWTVAGWEAREQGWAWNGKAWGATGTAWTEPRYWTDRRWNQPNYPVVGVSWYEAVAFCQWLTAVTGEHIALPTEQQWQRAAQGNTDRAYPWGDTFDASRCNCAVGTDWPQNRTSPVTHYEGKGDSPFGVVDMTGNVWEWCLTDYESGSQFNNISARYRALRGGSWFYTINDVLRVDYRDRNNPVYWYNNWGFRLTRS